VTTLTTLPLYAPPTRETQVIFTLTESGANFVRVWVTVAPPGSELRADLEKSTQSRFQIYQGDGGANAPWKRKFDKGGKYTLVCQEYRRGASDYGGGYQGAPDGDPSETQVGAESTLSLFIGQRMTAEIGANGDTATLVLWVWDGSIRATTVGVHGEVTPDLQNETPTAKARAAMESATVTALVDALAGITVDNATSGHDSALDDFIINWNAHLSQSGVHQENDAANGIPNGLRAAASSTSLKEAIGEILTRVRNHYTNDVVLAGVSSGRDSGNFHNVSGTKRNDNSNLPIISGVGDADAYWSIAELHRSYEAHRVSTALHDAADTTNALAALSPLLALQSAFLSVLASTSPTAPPAQSSGAMKLISRAQFSETPL
jgi:hypothetical protein